MDLSQSLVSAITKPSFAFDHSHQQQPQSPNTLEPQVSWESSLLNPKNRILSLDTRNSKWRIDGATQCGRQFYAVPVCLLPEMIPLRIDIYIPDQEQHPPELRNALQSSFSVCMRHPRLENLGISRHICRALDHQCVQDSKFLQNYQKLPFGSKLVFENIAAHVESMVLTIVPNYELERQFLSVPTLQKLWADEIPKASWPEIVDLRRLRLRSQLHDTISVISLLIEDEYRSGGDLIFKSSNNDTQFIYHELKMLLKCPPHPNIMGLPLYIVTKKSNFGGKHGVCGFILPYYPLGSIRDVIPVNVAAGRSTFKQQLKWSRQILSALIHIREEMGTFYSDLRPDNLLLSKSGSGPDEDIVLCDFEQRGNWHEWCAPEILYLMYAENLWACPSLDAQNYIPRDLVERKLQKGAAGDGPQSQSIRRGPHGSNPAWFSLSHSAHEKAQVYSVGLLLYCIFEGLSNVRISLANAWPSEPHIAFPDFRRTPKSVQDCIRQCTIDSPEWELEAGRPKPGEEARNFGGRITRKDAKLYTAGGAPIDSDAGTSAKAVFEAAVIWWRSEVRRAKAFFGSDQWQRDRSGRARPTLRDVLAMLEAIESDTDE